VTDGAYVPTLVKNITRVLVSLANLSFENNNRTVDMSSGHTETFRGSVYDLDGDGEPDFSDDDIDGDDLANDVETNIGTDPEDPDSDDDGIPDGYEFEHPVILDPLDGTDAVLDYDEDGLTNLDEYLNGTRPDAADSDGDGVDDPTELECGTDPLNYTDANEDWDGDGFSNSEECKAGTDPLDPDDMPYRPTLDWMLVTIVAVLLIILLLGSALMLLVKRKREEEE